MPEIYVGNLSFNSTEQSIQEVFSPYGQVDRVSIIMDRMTGRSRGFAFVTMPNAEEARAAIEAVNGTELDGRTLRVNEAKGKDAGGGGGGFRGSGGGGGGGFRGGRGGGGGRSHGRMHDDS